MFAFPSMLLPMAEKAGIATPADPDANYDMRDYPHFAVFCLMQLGTPFPDIHTVWENAEIIASVPDDHIMKVTAQELLDNGFVANVRLP